MINDRKQERVSDALVAAGFPGVIVRRRQPAGRDVWEIVFPGDVSDADRLRALDIADAVASEKPKTRAERVADLRKLKPEEREALLLELLAERME